MHKRSLNVVRVICDSVLKNAEDAGGKLKW